MFMDSLQLYIIYVHIMVHTNDDNETPNFTQDDN
jgi:hypothetical protein